MSFLLLLLGILACTGNLVNASCKLEMNPPRVVVRYGDSLKATCSSTGDVEGMGWESTYGGTGLKKDVSSLVLNITSVKAWELEPQCYASLRSDGSQCTETLPVTVYKLPQSVTLSQLSGKGAPMVEGQLYQMKCDVVNVAPVKNLSISWYKGRSIYSIETFEDPSPFPVNISSEKSVTVNRNDNGAYIWCEAMLNLGSVDRNLRPMLSQPKELTVLYPPTFDTPFNETVELPAGKTISLICTAKGNPKPVYRWDFPDPAQETNEKHDSSKPILTPAFPIPGTYTCTASNSQGSSIKYFQVVEASEDRTTFGVILGVFVSLGVLLLISGLFFVTQNGTFSCSKNNYTRGQATSSGPV